MITYGDWTMRWIVLLALFLNLAGCNSEKVVPERDGEDANDTQAVQIELGQPRVFGEFNVDFSRYSLRVYDSQNSWSQFIEDHASGNLAAELQAVQADFDTEHLLAYVFNESSGSIEVTPLPPQVADNALHINIERVIPSTGTTDIATYLLVYRVNQSFDAIYFDNGKENLMFPNEPGEYTEALNCEDLGICKGEPQVAKIQELEIPFSEHGYSNFNTAILGNQEQLNDFTKNGIGDNGWNDKETFVNALLETDIDFAQYNLLIYRFTEASGSNGVRLLEPIIEGDIATILVSRSVPGPGMGGIAAAAFYAAAYQVDKTLDEVRFEGGKNDEFFENTPGQDIAPLNCSAWISGCKSCNRANDGSVTCSEANCPGAENTIICKTWVE